MIGSGHLRGKRVLVTGGTTGIGRATVALLGQHGARVVTFGRHEKELADALRYSGQFGEVHGLIADASEAAGVERVYQAVEANLAGLDILVACAALGAHPIHEMSDHDWRYAIEPGSTGSDMRECDPPEQRDLIGQHRMLRAEQVAEAILFVLTREENCDIVSLRIEPRLQKGG